MNEVEKIIKQLALLPHPEWGYFRETYRSKNMIPQDALSSGYDGDRNHSTGIYFLITSETFSAFHKIRQDEMWHYYKGASLRLHMISPEGTHTQIVIGNKVLEGEHPQFTVPGGCWFAAEVTIENSYSLMGCTVAPGFDFNDFVLPKRKELITLFPKHTDLITKLTHS